MQRSARDLYLDLLIKTLTNMIYGDPSTHPLNRGPFQAELRRTGDDWPLLAHTMVGVRRLENLRALAQKAIDEKIPGEAPPSPNTGRACAPTSVNCGRAIRWTRSSRCSSAVRRG
jgi:hypothetical protein